MKMVKKVIEETNNGLSFTTYWFENQWVVEEEECKIRIYYKSNLMLSYESKKVFMPSLITRDEAENIRDILTLFSNDKFKIDLF